MSIQVSALGEPGPAVGFRTASAPGFVWQIQAPVDVRFLARDQPRGGGPSDVEPVPGDVGVRDAGQAPGRQRSPGGDQLPGPGRARPGEAVSDGPAAGARRVLGGYDEVAKIAAASYRGVCRWTFGGYDWTLADTWRQVGRDRVRLDRILTVDAVTARPADESGRAVSVDAVTADARPDSSAGRAELWSETAVGLSLIHI